MICKLLRPLVLPVKVAGAAAGERLAVEAVAVVLCTRTFWYKDIQK